MQTKLLLVLVTTIGFGTGCGRQNSRDETAKIPDSEVESAKVSESQAALAKTSDTIIRYVSDTIIKKQKMANLRDTIIKHKASEQRDTIIKHAAATIGRCKKVPRPPDCPVSYLSLKIDTIIK
jgi:hypothetical protein